MKGGALQHGYQYINPSGKYPPAGDLHNEVGEEHHRAQRLVRGNPERREYFNQARRGQQPDRALQSDEQEHGQVQDSDAFEEPAHPSIHIRCALFQSFFPPNSSLN